MSLTLIPRVTECAPKLQHIAKTSVEIILFSGIDPEWNDAHFKQIERFAKMENKLIPVSLDYAGVTGLRNEARQKLIKFTPRSLGQALRISGITPADVTLLAIHLDRRSSAHAG